MIYKNILNELYQRYYESAGISSAASSHWKKYGSLARVVRKNGHYVLSGVGFGNFINSHSFRSLKYTIPNIRLHFLLNKYSVNRKIELSGFRVAKKAKRQVDFDCIKQVLSVDLLLKYKILNKVKTVVVIGDGYGYTTSLLRTILPEATIICVNLGRMLFFDVYYVKRIFPDEKCYLNNEFKFNSMQKASIVFLEAEKLQDLFLLPVDLYINIASIQEMNMSAICDYFRIMRSGEKGERYFYCCNRVKKKLPDGSVVCFEAYPWDRNDDVILDELCPWYQRFPVWQPPFWKAFDGPIRHRLLKLHKYEKY